MDPVETLLRHIKDRLRVAGRKSEEDPCVLKPVEVLQLQNRIANVLETHRAEINRLRECEARLNDLQR